MSVRGFRREVIDVCDILHSLYLQYDILAMMQSWFSWFWFIVIGYTYSIFHAKCPLFNKNKNWEKKISCLYVVFV